MRTQAAHGRALPGPTAQELSAVAAREKAADIVFANPPSPGDDTWIRCQYRAGQRAPEGTVWPQTALAQLAALFRDRRVALIDAGARRLSWRQFGEEVGRWRPLWYVTQVAGPTLESDMAGVALAKAAGARTVVFGPLVTPIARQVLLRFPALDYVLSGEPEVTLRELVDTVDGRWGERPPEVARLCDQVGDVTWPRTLGAVRGLAWRHEGQVLLNYARPLIPQLDDLPLPAHELLPLGAYRAPVIDAPAAMVVTGRGCPAACSFCLKHVTYGRSVRLRSPEHIVAELLLLQGLGARHVYMQADLFGACRDQVAGLCRLMVSAGMRLSWSCHLRADAADAHLLRLMGEARCRRITWALESGSDALLRRMGKDTRVAQAERALAWARGAGIHSWGSFMLGLPGETEDTLGQTVALAKKLGLERATFDLAVPRPGTPLWEEAIAHDWLRPGVSWEDGDPGGPAIIGYPWLPAERLECWQERAYREWALRPGSLWGQLRHLAPLRGLSPLYGPSAG